MSGGSVRPVAAVLRDFALRVALDDSESALIGTCLPIHRLGDAQISAESREIHCGVITLVI